MANRCFSDLNRAVTTSSDRTEYQKSATIYKSIERNYARGFGPNPLKGNGYRYQNNFFFANCDNPNQDVSGVALAAHSYDLLLSLSKGNFFANPTLQSASSAKYQMWGGNCTEINYSAGGKYRYPNLFFGFTQGGDASNITVSGDRIPYPFGCENDCSFSGQYPGYVTDPSNLIFYRPCFEQDAQRSPSWIANVADVSFRWTQYYWRGANAQPLQGFEYPKSVRMWRREPKQTQYSPLPPAGSTDDLGTLFCEGYSAIN